MAWSDDIALLNLRIARQERYRDWIEGTNSNVFEIEERMQIGVIQHIQTVVTLMIPLVHLIIDGLVQVVVTTYFAWWRSQYPTVDENETDPVTLLVYDAWKAWSDNGSNVRNGNW